MALFIYNRPEKTAAVLQVLRVIRPSQLFVIADGPRPQEAADARRVARTRDLIDASIDWRCDLRKNYSDAHLGCRFRPITGYAWVFTHVERCIFLEDDCIPHQSFFPFCWELLERYANDDRVFAISGDNFQFGRDMRSAYSYYYSGILHCWGWATWKRAWNYYDPDMRLWPAIRAAGYLEDIWGDPEMAKHWKRCFDITFSGLDAWDYQFALACQIHHGLCIVPNVNLVTNCGFDRDATHTRRITAAANIPSEEMAFPLLHPPHMIRDSRADQFELELMGA